MPSDRRMLPGGRDHDRVPSVSGAVVGGAMVGDAVVGGAVVGGGGSGPSIGPDPGSTPGAGAALASHGPRSGVGDAGSLAAVPASPGAGSVSGTTVGGGGAVPAGSGARPGGGVPGSRGPRSGADAAGSVASGAVGCPGSGPVARPVDSGACFPRSRPGPAWPRRVSRAATARNRASPAPAPPRGPPPSGMPGSGSWPGAATGAGERIASNSDAVSPASGGSSVMCRPRQEIRARARPDRHPGPRR
jgi:translation initiation factor IF-2